MYSSELPIRIREKAIDNKVIILQNNSETRTASGLILNESDITNSGIVISKGVEVKDGYNVGDTVILGKNNGTIFKVKDLNIVERNRDKMTKEPEFVDVILVYGAEISMWRKRESTGNDETPD